MEPSTLVTSTKPPRYWFFVVLVAGAAGAMIAIAAGGKGTYDVAPYRLELRAMPAALGATELAVRSFGRQVPVHATAGTHKAPMKFRVTILGTSSAATPDDLAALRSPRAMASFYGDNAKSATRAFALKLLALALAGGTAAGGALSFGRRWRRIAGGALAGVLTFAVVGLLVYKTYDANEFSKTRFVIEKQSKSPAPDLTSVLPS
jgi:peptidoglycan/LPS O-acetylase OafA/YrhL